MKTKNIPQKTDKLAPRLTLKSVKVNLGLSEETFAFTATLYVNGARYGFVSNAGHGGPCQVRVLEAQNWKLSELELNNLIKETFPLVASKLFPEGRQRDLDDVLSELVSDFLIERDFKKALKKFVFLQDGELFTIKKPNATTLEKVRNFHNTKGAIFLADLPEEDALALYRKHA